MIQAAERKIVDAYAVRILSETGQHPHDFEKESAIRIIAKLLGSCKVDYITELMVQLHDRLQVEVDEMKSQNDLEAFARKCGLFGSEISFSELSSRECQDVMGYLRHRFDKNRRVK